MDVDTVMMCRPCKRAARRPGRRRAHECSKPGTCRCDCMPWSERLAIFEEQEDSWNREMR